MMLFLYLVPFLGVAVADVFFSTPASGAVVYAGDPFTLSWEESNLVPLIEDFISYKIFLCFGTNETYVRLSSHFLMPIPTHTL
jgi:hypothetical protein